VKRGCGSEQRQHQEQDREDALHGRLRSLEEMEIGMRPDDTEGSKVESTPAAIWNRGSGFVT